MLELLQITRPTLIKYVKEGMIKTTTLSNGRYDYDKDSIYKLLNKGIDRKTYLYVLIKHTVKKFFSPDFYPILSYIKNYVEKLLKISNNWYIIKYIINIRQRRD